MPKLHPTTMSAIKNTAINWYVSLQGLARGFMLASGHWFYPMFAVLEIGELIAAIQYARQFPSRKTYLEVAAQVLRTLLMTTGVVLALLTAGAIISGALSIVGSAFVVSAIALAGMELVFKGALAKLDEKPWKRLVFNGLMVLTIAASLGVIFFFPPAGAIAWATMFAASTGSISTRLWSPSPVSKALVGTAALGVLTVILLTAGLAIPGLNIAIAVGVVVAATVTAALWVLKRRQPGPAVNEVVVAGIEPLVGTRDSARRSYKPDPKKVYSDLPKNGHELVVETGASSKMRRSSSRH